MADGELLDIQLVDKRRNLLAGRFRKNQRHQEAGIEIKHSTCVLRAFIPRLAQQNGARPPQAWHRGAKPGEIIQR